jgi:lysophospholipase L1-like esterase
VTPRALLTLGVLVVTAASCERSGTAPSPPDPSGAIALTRPGDIRIENVIPPGVPVTFALPVASGGGPSIAVSCLPASGSVFPIGTTIVTCAGTDGVRSGVTQFSVTLVAVIPDLQRTRFLAFGDSITRGELQTNPSLMAIDDDRAYPTVLERLLSERYLRQTIVVVNRGVAGESAVEGNARIGGVLTTERPDVLLLLEGVIDMGDGLPQIPGLINTLRSDIATARAQGVGVIFLGTLLPQKPPLPGFPPFNTPAMPFIDAANIQIRALAASEGVVLVDANAAMAPQVTVLIGGDGLHPTEQGYKVLAQTFFDAIKARLEVLPGAMPQRR